MSGADVKIAPLYRDCKEEDSLPSVNHRVTGRQQEMCIITEASKLFLEDHSQTSDPKSSSFICFPLGVRSFHSIVFKHAFAFSRAKLAPSACCLTFSVSQTQKAPWMFSQAPLTNPFVILPRPWWSASGFSTPGGLHTSQCKNVNPVGRRGLVSEMLQLLFKPGCSNRGLFT